MKKTILFLCLVTSVIFGKDISLDNQNISLSIKNNSTSALNLPFYPKNAKLTSSYQDKYTIELQGKTILVTPKIDDFEIETANLYLWDKDDDLYSIHIDAAGNDVDGDDSLFNLTLKTKVLKNKRLIKRFETGSIKKDIKNLIKKAVLNHKIAGYKKTIVENKKIYTNDLVLQKSIEYDGSKYRVEEWMIGNRTNKTLALSEENFYTKGILAVSFETNTLNPRNVIKMWLIINKSSLKD